MCKPEMCIDERQILTEFCYQRVESNCGLASDVLERRRYDIIHKCGCRKMLQIHAVF